VAKSLAVLCQKIIEISGCITKLQSVKKWHTFFIRHNKF